MSKLQNPFKTLTEQNLSRKTLPWLWSGISLGVGGPADPWNILKRDSWFTQCTILANRPRSDIQYTCRAQALRLAKNAKFLGFFYHTPRSVTGTCTDITEVFILGEREGEYQNYSCRLNEDHANVCEEVGSERIRSLTHISSQEENTPQTILHGWVTNLRLTLSPIWWGVGGVHTPSALHQIGLRARINIHALYHFYLGTIIPHVTWFFSWKKQLWISLRCWYMHIIRHSPFLPLLFSENWHELIIWKLVGYIELLCWEECQDLHLGKQLCKTLSILQLFLQLANVGHFKSSSITVTR